MVDLDLQQRVHTLLGQFKGPDPIKRLFWTELGYQRVNDPLSRRNWPESTASLVAEDPVLLSEQDGFAVIHVRLQNSELSRPAERQVAAKLLSQYPYALFVFSNSQRDRWHFLNVKRDGKSPDQRMFRRIAVGPGEQLRTAAERLSLLDMEPMGRNPSALEIQNRHDEAFDVEKVTKRFFEQYAQVFAQVEGLITGIEDSDRKRLFTQRLFNRLMFIAFIQKKGWLKFGGATNYLEALWRDYQRNGDKDAGFYDSRLKVLFFSGLNTKGEVDIVGINRNGFVQKLIGQVPYLNGGLFEEDGDDTDAAIHVPDAAIDSIIHDLFGRFNFTVTESTPLDVEVAVDPEMLGKVFEELVTGRHETGSYYTPKPVVAFMGREALKGYLGSQLAIEEQESLERFVDVRDPSGLRDPEAVLEALRRIKACDPACGSGAYLLGMLHELLELRACLFVTHNLDPLKTYDRKLEIIQNSLYGVDIDPFAVNIARLRLWLSLAVDFDGDSPPPLPNLDFKIEAGDSLLAPVHGAEKQETARSQLIDRYLSLKARYMKAHGGEKRALLKEIETEKEAISLWTHGGASLEGFDWQVEFAEVFADRGFDVVLANPPYVRHELIRHLKPALQKVFPAVYNGTADLYCYFYARGIELLRSGGMLAFISSNKWFTANYGGNLRKYVAESCDVSSITDMGELPVFETATTYPMIFVAQKGKGGGQPTVFTEVKTLAPPYPDVLAIIRQSGIVLPDRAVSGSNWTLTGASVTARFRKMESMGISLGEYVSGQIYRGILTGLNAAFVIDGKRRHELIAADPRSAEIIKPLAVGDNVRKWRIEREKWLILTPIGIDIKRYPAIFEHLKQWQPQLEARWDKGQHWWELRACDYYDKFDKPKIVFPEICNTPRFAFDNDGTFSNNKVFLIPLNDLFLLGVLNSAPAWEYTKSLCSALKGGYAMLQWVNFKRLRIPPASDSERALIAALVERCLSLRGKGCDANEREIDERVAALYGL
jgi:hypothetical protein